MPRIIELTKFGNNEIGYLSFFEFSKEIEFMIKRIYFIYKVPQDIRRGFHAHKKLKQFIWCPQGAINIVLDNGFARKSFLLDEPSKGLIIEEGFWREIIWVIKDSILCVAASECYDENDYIKSYDEFCKKSKRGDWGYENKF